MRPSRLRRLIPLCLLFILSFLGLLSVTAALPDDKKKAPPFPQSLFAQATAEDYLDDELCAECHRSAHTSAGHSPHALYMMNPRNPVDKRGCQGCHGPGALHVAHLKDEDEPFKYVISYTKAKPAEASAACLRCHNDTLSAAHWKRTGHARANVACTACHQMHWPERLGRDRSKEPTTEDRENGRGVPAGARQDVRSPVFPAGHDPKALLKAEETKLCGQCHKREVAEFRHNFHHPIPEGRMVCSDCHTIHPDRNNQKRLRTAKQTCVNCHGDVAGPFVFEHDPVNDLASDGCLECHRPHGSHNPKMLNLFSRGLCNQCHTDKANNHFPGRNCWQAGCHASVHGSNRDRLLLRP